MYKWKPSAAHRAEYREKCVERSSLQTFVPADAIRTGDSLTYYNMTQGRPISAVVHSHSYGADRGQHTFTLQEADGVKHQVKGRNLYPNVTAFQKLQSSKE